MNKLVLSTALLLLGTTSTQLPKTPISFSSEAKAYNISENETNINELSKHPLHSAAFFIIWKMVMAKAQW